MASSGQRSAISCQTNGQPVSVTSAEPPNPILFVPALNFCPACGGKVEQRVPEGDLKPRAVCTVCQKIHYQNPKMVVGCIPEYEGKVLLCKRKIEPCYGLWTLPAGYMENGESAAEGAARETLEEACADVEIVAPFAHLDIPLIAQSYIIFRARMRSAQYSAGEETLEAKLFAPEDIPFNQIAFSAVLVALQKYVDDARQGRFLFHYGAIEKKPGSKPSDPNGFLLRNHITSGG